MLKGAFEGDALWKKIVFTVVISLVFTTLGYFLWYVAAYIYYRPTDMAAMTALIAGADIALLKSLQFVQSICLFVLPSFALACLWSSKPIGYLGLNRKFSLESLLFAIAAMLFVLPFINLLAEINSGIKLPDFLSGIELWMKEMEQNAEDLTKRMLQADTFSIFLFNVLLMAVLPGVGEELFFRGIIQKIMTEKCGQHKAVWITAIIFSAIHFQFYGFFPRLVLGLLLGYMYVWSGSLWLPIIAHFTHNFLAVTAFYLMSRQITDIDMDAVGTISADSWMLGVVSLGLFIAMVALLYRSIQKNANDAKNTNILKNDY